MKNPRNSHYLAKQNLSNSKFDSNFYLSSQLEFLITNRLNWFDSYRQPAINQITYSIWVKNLDNLNSRKLSGAFVALFIVSGGKKPYIYKMGLYSTFKKKVYDVIMHVSIKSSECQQNMLFFSNRIFPYLTQLNSKIEFIEVKELKPFRKKLAFGARKNTQLFKYQFDIFDLTFFDEIELNPIFFKWKENLKVSVFFLFPTKINDLNYLHSMLNLYKINIKDFATLNQTLFKKKRLLRSFLFFKERKKLKALQETKKI